MSTDSSSLNRGLVVFSGGSAANNLVDVFSTVQESKQCSLSYIIPISDNGGSSSELIRIFGGPGIGDVRSKYACIYNRISSRVSTISISASWYSVTRAMLMRVQVDLSV